MSQVTRVYSLNKNQRIICSTTNANGAVVTTPMEEFEVCSMVLHQKVLIVQQLNEAYRMGRVHTYNNVTRLCDDAIKKLYPS